jgi:hypothetical protein
LGYLDNSYGIKYEDSVAFSKVLTVNPKAVWCSKEADDIIKKITFQFVEDHPLFFLKTLAAKALKLLLYFLKCSNLGFLCFFYVRPAWREMVPLAAGAVFYCLPGLLVMPYLAYVFGMVAMSTVFGIYMFGLAIEEFIQSKDGLIPGWMKA